MTTTGPVFGAEFTEFYGELCDIYERNVWGPYDPDDGWKHTSTPAREFAFAVCKVFAELSDNYPAGDRSDAHLDDLVCGVRRTFDEAVIGARAILCEHPRGCRCGFQPNDDPTAFAPCEIFGGASRRANDVARRVAGLLGWFPVAS